VSPDTISESKKGGIPFRDVRQSVKPIVARSCSWNYLYLSVANENFSRVWI